MAPELSAQALEAIRKGAFEYLDQLGIDPGARFVMGADGETVYVTLYGWRTGGDPQAGVTATVQLGGEPDRPEHIGILLAGMVGGGLLIRAQDVAEFRAFVMGEGKGLEPIS